MIKNLNHLLPGNGFFRKTIDHTQVLLLLRISLAPLLHNGFAKEGKQRRSNNGNPAKNGIGIQHQHNGSYNGNRT